MFNSLPKGFKSIAIIDMLFATYHIYPFKSDYIKLLSLSYNSFWEKNISEVGSTLPTTMKFCTRITVYTGSKYYLVTPYWITDRSQLCFMASRFLNVRYAVNNPTEWNGNLFTADSVKSYALLRSLRNNTDLEWKDLKR